MTDTGFQFRSQGELPSDHTWVTSIVKELHEVKAGEGKQDDSETKKRYPDLLKEVNEVILDMENVTADELMVPLIIPRELDQSLDKNVFASAMQHIKNAARTESN